MGLMFGMQDDIDCLLPTTFDGPHGGQLCLASRVSEYFFAGGVYVRDQGYVLKVKGGSSYYTVTDAELRALQEQQILPATLPPHHISTVQYLIGYSLWIVVAVIGLFALLKKMFGKMQPFLAARTAPVTGPPTMKTEGDRWIADQLAKHLESGEKVQHQAVATNFEPGVARKGAKQMLLGLTDRRLIVIEALVGFTGRKRETGECGALQRDHIVGVAQVELRFDLHFADGTAQSFWVIGSQRRYSNQWLFARDVPKLLAAQETKAA